MAHGRIRVLWTVVLLAGTVSLASAASAIITDFRGKVDIRNTSGTWVSAAKGMTLENGSVISTGFNSTAVIAIGPTSISVQQLTRMRLDELVEKQGRLTTSFTLPIGRVQARVKSADGAPQDFQIRTPISTAAVRGTEFDFDGYRLVVTDGTVQFINKIGQGRGIQHGQESETDGENPPAPPEDGFSSDSSTGLPTTPGGSTGGATGGNVTTGTIVVTW